MLQHIASQIGQTERDGNGTSSAVAEYLTAAGVQIDGEAPAWSGGLLAWSAIKSGLVPPINAADPLQWISWGSALAAPLPGAVVILTDGSGRARWLCGVAARVLPRKVYVVGAFDGQVQTRAFPIEQVIAARKPPGSGAMTAATITIEHDPGEAVAALQTLPMIPAAPMVPTDKLPSVEPQHIEALLSLVQQKFAAIDDRIDAVQRSAIADVRITEAS